MGVCTPEARPLVAALLLAEKAEADTHGGECKDSSTVLCPQFWFIGTENELKMFSQRYHRDIIIAASNHGQHVACFPDADAPTNTLYQTHDDLLQLQTLNQHGCGMLYVKANMLVRTPGTPAGVISTYAGLQRDLLSCGSSEITLMWKTV